MTTAGRDQERATAYRRAFVDWLACAIAGRYEPAVRAAAAVGDDLVARVAAAGTAGHVLDFDDTYTPGLAHLSAATAPVALVVGAETEVSLGTAIRAYADGFEAMGAVARWSHPRLYESGWHPTAVCGTVGAAVVASRLLELDDETASAAADLATIGAAGLLSAFGSDGKSLQVGAAAATGIRAALLARGGARVGADVQAGFHRSYGGSLDGPDRGRYAIDENWLKAYPCCLQTHSAIEAAADAVALGAGPAEVHTVVVHPISRQAAAYDDVATPLQAKFSIPYLTAYTLLNGPPTLASFASVDPDARELGRAIRVVTDPDVSTSYARVEWRDAGTQGAEVQTALGSPSRPLPTAVHENKVRLMAGRPLDDDEGRPVAELLAEVDS